VAEIKPRPKPESSHLKFIMLFVAISKEL